MYLGVCGFLWQTQVGTLCKTTAKQTTTYGILRLVATFVLYLYGFQRWKSKQYYPLVIWHSHGKWTIYGWFTY